MTMTMHVVPQRVNYLSETQDGAFVCVHEGGFSRIFDVTGAEKDGQGLNQGVGVEIRQKSGEDCQG